MSESHPVDQQNPWAQTPVHQFHSESSHMFQDPWGQSLGRKQPRDAGPGEPGLAL